MLLLLALLVQERHVSTSGADANPGTSAAPWRTIQKAAREARPGDVVLIHAGTYAESVAIEVSGAEGKPITFKAAGDGPARIDGAKRPAADPLILIENRSHLVVEGLELLNAESDDPEVVPCGVWLKGAGEDVALRKLKVSRIRQLSKEGGDAHGIAVYGTDGKVPWSRIAVEGCEIFDCRLGSSEAIALNGNVDVFLVAGNTVRDCDNIGIVAIGHEKTAPANDQARRGRIAGNTVFNISSFGNPAYGAERSAAGIYVDGGRDILIERNLVRHCDYGIEVGCENAGTATDVVVRSNVLYRNAVAGLIFGGYDEERGSVERCLFAHNTLWSNDTTESESGEIVIQKSRDNVLRHNLIVPGKQGLAITNPFASEGNAADWNVYGGKDPSFVWREAEIQGLAAFRTAGQERNGRAGDPGFLDVQAGNLRTRRGSAAVDAGDPAYKPAPGELDFSGAPRMAGPRVDAGAFELKR